ATGEGRPGGRRPPSPAAFPPPPTPPVRGRPRPASGPRRAARRYSGARPGCRSYRGAHADDRQDRVPLPSAERAGAHAPAVAARGDGRAAGAAGARGPQGGGLRAAVAVRRSDVAVRVRPGAGLALAPRDLGRPREGDGWL